MTIVLEHIPAEVGNTAQRIKNEKADGGGRRHQQP